MDGAGKSSDTPIFVSFQDSLLLSQGHDRCQLREELKEMWGGGLYDVQSYYSFNYQHHYNAGAMPIFFSSKVSIS